MEQVVLRAESRTEFGSRPSRRLRRQGLIPAIVYGRDLDTIHVAVNGRDLYAALHTEAGFNALINLEMGDQTVLSVAREVQRHPVRGDISHLDFIQVSLDEPIEADVSLEFVGSPAGVREGGFLEPIESTVLIEALPTQIPGSITVEIDELHIGDTLTVRDIPEIEGVTLLGDLDRPIVTVLAPRVLIEEEEEAVEEIEGLEVPEAPEGEAAAEPEE